MATSRKDRKRAVRRKNRVRGNLHTETLPRLSVFRSLNHIYAQIIDDVSGGTLVSSSSLIVKDATGDKKAIAEQVGKKLAQNAKEKGINRVLFDRGPYLFHGRVQALAKGLHEEGIQI